jgi:uncharacterized membrane protein YfcA
MTLLPLQLLLVVLVGVFAGTVNTIAGGGSLITLPALIFLGVPPTVANGTNRVGVMVQSFTAATSYHRKGMLDLRRALRMLVPIAVGTLVGAWASAQLSDELFKKVIGVAMLCVLGLMLAKPKRWLSDRPASPPGPLWARIPALVGIGFYGGFLCAGVGVVTLITLVLLEGCDLLRGNAIKVTLVGCCTLLSLVVFVEQGLVAWDVALSLAAGSSLGGWLGSRLTMSWGPPLIRWVLITVVLVSSGRLLGLY